jgi:hypothetical protein
MTIRNRYQYTDDNGLTHPILIHDDTFGAQPTTPPQVWTSSISARASRSARKRGLTARGCYLSRIIGTGATAYRVRRWFPILLPADVTTLRAAGSITIGTQAWSITAFEGETER